MPGKRCSACTHPKATEIDASLAAGTSTGKVAAAHGLSQSSVARHRVNHLLPATEENSGNDAATLLREMRQLQGRVTKLLTKAEKSGNATTMLNAAREVRQCLKQIAEIAGVLEHVPQVNVEANTTMNVGFLRQVILEALEPYPEARQKVAAALIEATEAGGGP